MAKNICMPSWLYECAVFLMFAWLVAAVKTNNFHAEREVFPISLSRVILKSREILTCICINFNVPRAFFRLNFHVVRLRKALDVSKRVRFNDSQRVHAE